MKRKLLLILLSLIGFTSAHASEFGISAWVPVVPKDPPHVHGYRFALTWQPKYFVWEHFSLYFDAGFGHWWINGTHYHDKSVSIVSVAPYFRAYFLKRPYFSPFAEVSIGPAYINKTRFDCYNQGIHYTFQDQISIGSAFFADQSLYVALTALHYSNGSMSNSNAGITIPVVLNVGYRF